MNDTLESLLARNAELEAERDANVKNVHRLMNGINSIYAELERVAPWSQSNDMDGVDEIMCAIGLLAQERDALAAENKALRADAERYRWLRDKANEANRSAPMVTANPLDFDIQRLIYGAELDAAIDAARTTAAAGGEP